VTGSSVGEVVIPVHRPELKEKVFFFVSGMVSSIPLTLFFGQFADALVSSLPPLYALLLSSVIFSPFMEEFAKAFPLLYRHGETEKSIFVLGLLVGLGFGLIEFIIYVFLLGVPFVFRLAGILFHAASTSITAYGIATRRAFMFYLVAVGLHFLNNLWAFVEFAVEPEALFGVWSIGTYFVMFTTLSLAWRLYNKTSEKIST
jgi:RsiW-degrading membrane proteinase PrsW (M82 family)